MVTDLEERLLGFSDQNLFWVYNISSNFESHFLLSFKHINCAFLYVDKKLNNHIFISDLSIGLSICETSSVFS